MSIVYRHRKLNDYKVFYIGIGKNIKRAYSKRSRNNLWHNIVNKNGYIVEIIAENISFEKCKELEILLIKEYGRLDIGTGILSNMTDGGDGNTNFSEETKKKISESLKGLKQSKETIEKRIKKLKECYRNNPELIELKRKQSIELNKLGLIGTKGMPSKKKGIPISNESKKKLSLSLKEYYKTNKPHNFKIIDKETEENIYYDFLNKINKFQLHKKYNLNRRIIDRIINSYAEQNK